MPNVATILSNSAAKYPDAPAILLDDIVLSYAALDGLSAKVAGLLASRGVKAGDRVALVSPNIPQMPALYYGILRFGAVVVPLNPLLKAREVEYHLQNSEASLVFAWEGILDQVQPAAEAVGIPVVPVDAALLPLLAEITAIPEIAPVKESDTAVILYTSGTTGRPKGAELTHSNLLSNASVSRDLFETGPGDVLFGGLPFFHIFGQTCALNAAMLAGAAVTLLPKFDPVKALEIVQRDKVTIFMGVPTMHIAVLRVPNKQDYDLSSLKVGVSGGAPLPLEVLREYEASFGVTMLEGYGLSETSPVVSFNQLDGVRKPGSIGTPVRGAQMRVSDDAGHEVPRGEVGEIAVAGPYVMKGYWRNPEATESAIRDGWFYTGDLGTEDEDGVFFVVDRKKDMILRGGYNVYPREVEEVLYEHPAVAEAAVKGRPDEVHGEEIIAVVSLKPGVEDNGELAEEIRDYVKERIAAYKYPREVRIVEELPKGPTGKILKREIEV
ncbi:long-chain fatty acid--CoA ligase [Psychromicrobium sp. YIM B11713]|uniref:long-chain-fatty-acid--CoA ligase n=1 Tax=Psychromicrobium sp. YIM B11713 TaxID=3145233 RepID=UPI00374F3602